MSSTSFKTKSGFQTKLPPANLSLRVRAFLTDLAFITVLVFIQNLILVEIIERGLNDQELIFIIFLVVSIEVPLYFLLSESVFNGQTVGMKYKKIKVIKTDGRKVDFNAAFVRFLFGIIEIYLFFGIPSIILILFFRRGQRLGDIFARTMVVSLNEECWGDCSESETIEEGGISNYKNIIEEILENPKEYIEKNIPIDEEPEDFEEILKEEPEEVEKFETVSNKYLEEEEESREEDIYAGGDLSTYYSDQLDSGDVKRIREAVRYYEENMFDPKASEKIEKVARSIRKKLGVESGEVPHTFLSNVLREYEKLNR